jgi:hypothetical protein
LIHEFSLALAFEEAAMRIRSFAMVVGLIGLLPGAVRADPFDNYTNTILSKIAESKSAEKITKLTPALMLEHGRALPGISATFIVVKTNESRYAKLLVLPAEQKVSDKERLPIVLIERYVTFREGEERTVHASGKNVRLFADFRFNLDIGQVVPDAVSADLRVVVDKGVASLEPIGKAEMYVVTKHLSEANPAKPEKLEVGAKFEKRYFNGVYQMYDDGRRSGKMHVKVLENGNIVGWYYSDKDGAKYEVTGAIASNPLHKVEFDIVYPRVSQSFVGYLFTGDGSTISGFSKLQGLETGFYAKRIEGEK